MPRSTAKFTGNFFNPNINKYCNKYRRLIQITRIVLVSFSLFKRDGPAGEGSHLAIPTVVGVYRSFDFYTLLTRSRASNHPTRSTTATDDAGRSPPSPPPSLEREGEREMLHRTITQEKTRNNLSVNEKLRSRNVYKLLQKKENCTQIFKAAVSVVKGVGTLRHHPLGRSEAVHIAVAGGIRRRGCLREVPGVPVLRPPPRLFTCDFPAPARRRRPGDEEEGDDDE